MNQTIENLLFSYHTLLKHYEMPNGNHLKHSEYIQGYADGRMEMILRILEENGYKALSPYGLSRWGCNYTS